MASARMTEMLRRDTRLQRADAAAGNGERTLLLVDDEENGLAALKRLLRQDNYRVLTAPTAPAGFEILAGEQVGVIVSDQRMPEITGVEFLRRVKDSIRIPCAWC